MKMHKYLQVFLLLAGVVLVLVGYNNCAPSAGFEALSGSADSASHGQDLDKVEIPIALLSADQLYSSMISVASVPLGSQLQAEFNRRYSALAAGNNLMLANAPLLLAATSLGGEVCNLLVIQERTLAAAERRVFGSINFSGGPNLVTEDAYKTAVRALARQFWGRNETVEEFGHLQEFKAQFIEALATADQAKANFTNHLMQSTCAAMISSFDAITY